MRDKIGTAFWVKLEPSYCLTKEIAGVTSAT